MGGPATGVRALWTAWQGACARTPVDAGQSLLGTVPRSPLPLDRGVLLGGTEGGVLKKFWREGCRRAGGWTKVSLPRVHDLDKGPQVYTPDA